MHLRSAFSNPAGTVLTVHGYRTRHVGGRPVRTEHREDYVVAGDGHEILKSLLTRQPRGFLRILVAPSFSPLSDLPQSFREIAVTTVEEEIAADAITLAERDFFLNSGFPPNEIFKQLVERKSEERARFAEDRATEIRVSLEQIKPHIGTDAPPHENNAQ